MRRFALPVPRPPAGGGDRQGSAPRRSTCGAASPALAIGRKPCRRRGGPACDGKCVAKCTSKRSNAVNVRLCRAVRQGVLEGAAGPSCFGPWHSKRPQPAARQSMASTQQRKQGFAGADGVFGAGFKEPELAVREPRTLSCGRQQPAAVGKAKGPGRPDRPGRNACLAEGPRARRH